MQRRTGLEEEEDDDKERNEMKIERRSTPPHEIPTLASRETKKNKSTTMAPNVDEETKTLSKPKATIGNVDDGTVDNYYKDEQKIVATEIIQKMKQDNATQRRILEYDEECNEETLDGDGDDNSNTSNASTSDHPGAFAVNGQRMNDNGIIDDGTVQYSIGGGPRAATQTQTTEEEHQGDIEDMDPIPLFAETVPETVHGIAIELNAMQENNNSPRSKRMVVILSVTVFVLCVVAAVSIAFGVKSNKNDSKESDPVLPVTTAPATTSPSPTDFPTFRTSTEPSTVPSSAPTSIQQQIMTTLLEYFPNLPASNDQQQALNWILADPTSLGVLMEEATTCSNQKRTVLERFVLATVYFATNGLGWSRKNQWLSELSVCEWSRVQCREGDATTEHGEVGKLALGSNNLIGSIPTGVGLMTSMSELYLWSNALTGTIPTEFGMMTSMSKLSLSNNDLFGSIPTEIGMMTSMIVLHLYRNALNGSIPTEMGMMTSISELSLHTNNLADSVPTELGSLTRLTWFSIFYNNLIGSIPTEIGRMTSMTWLYLNDNILTGSIPTELGSLTRLTGLSFAGNPNLSGTIPSKVVAILPNLGACFMGGTNLIDIPENCQGVYPF